MFKDAEKIRNSFLFKKSNKIWNDEKLNSRMNIGSLMHLINTMQPSTLEEWINMYFESGKKYENLLLNHKYANYKEFGRSPKQLEIIATKLMEAINEQGYDINFNLAYKYVLIRVLYETWIGYSRERITLKKLQESFPNLIIRHTDQEIDSCMAVDFEVLTKGNKLLLGIQVKSPRIRKQTMDLNLAKNKKYIKKYNVDVFYLIEDNNELINIKELSTIIGHLV